MLNFLTYGSPNFALYVSMLSSVLILQLIDWIRRAMTEERGRRKWGRREGRSRVEV